MFLKQLLRFGENDEVFFKRPCSLSSTQQQNWISVDLSESADARCFISDQEMEQKQEFPSSYPTLESKTLTFGFWFPPEKTLVVQIRSRAAEVEVNKRPWGEDGTQTGTCEIFTLSMVLTYSLKTAQ